MNSRGFTLVEMMVSTYVYITIFLGMVIAIQLFGLRVYTLAATKLSATASCLKAMNGVRDQIREAKTLDIGTCNSTPDSFSSITTNNYQKGNALKIYSTTNAIPYILFYLDASIATNCNLKRSTVASNAANTILVTNTDILASFITNQDIFYAQDYKGNTLTNDQVTDNRMVVYMKMQFYQWEYPIAFIGGNALNAYNFYQLQTRITRRSNN
jgi:type II secretory pathway pseudopilin PulG